jgi:phosphate acetyltransferase
MPGMNVFEQIRARAKKKSRRIILPEGTDVRIVKAAAEASAQGLAKVTLLGDEKRIKDNARAGSAKLDTVTIIDPATSDRLDDYGKRFYGLRKHKGITEQEARKTITSKPVYYAALMVRAGEADGFVAGAATTSADVARAAIYCMGVDKTAGTLSSAFVINIDDCPYGEDGTFVFADCAIVPNPSPRQLAGIAYSSANLFKFLFEKEPIVAMLSYSTKGSAKGSLIEKVVEATKLAKKLYPEVRLDGELQLDSALVETVAKRKCADSPVCGKANVLIFPDLNSGNIAYKMAERLAGARAVGPLLQGLSKPCSDLSRGCKYEDVVDTVAVTAVREK